jgi:hypothetical protein
MVEDLKSTEWGLTGEAIHLHPRDTGGTLLSVDRHSPDDAMNGSYKWAGPEWRGHDRSKTIAQIVGAAIQSPDPADLAAKWSHLLQRPLRKAETGGMDIQLDLGFVHFGPLRDDRGEGLRAVYLKTKDKAAVLANARQAGVPHGDDYVDMAGVRFMLV